jgi:ABC-type bacteriocin/lantibiotic exporter with double-glycine peptidase domain
MVETARLEGFPATEALWRLLRRRGREGGLQAFRDAHPGIDAPETMVAPLEAEGLQARPVLLEGGDLCHLEGPTLLELKGGGWALLDRRRGDRCRLEIPAGEVHLGLEQLQEATTGRALELTPGLGRGPALWARLGSLFLAHRRLLVPALVATLALNVLGLATPLLSRVVMDRALPDRAAGLLVTVVAGLALAGLHQTWAAWLRDRLLLCVATRIEASAERGFLEHLLRCPFPFLQDKSLGDFNQAFAGFQAARNLLPLKTLGTVMNAGTAFIQLGLMLHYLPLPALLVLVSTLAQALATWLVGRVEAKLEIRQVTAQVREQSLLIELVSGIGTLKAAGAEGMALERWRGRFAAVLALARTQGQIRAWFDLGMGATGQAVGIVLLVWGGHGLLEGRCTIGCLFAFLQLAAGFNGSVQSLVGLALNLMMLRPQLAKAQEILEVVAEPIPGAEPPSPEPVAVVCEDVWFRYGPAQPWILKGIDLCLEPGDKHTLDGPSGSGKSTLLRLLAGLHAPERGTIRIQGRTPREARHQFAYLPQFARIYGGSVMDNLKLFSHDAPLERMIEASRATGLMELVDALPMGFQTLLPPGGGTLSGGQRQLIALAGAVASGRQLLILDEPLANLDPVWALRLRTLLLERPWTVLAAAHGTEPAR